MSFASPKCCGALEPGLALTRCQLHTDAMWGHGSMQLEARWLQSLEPVILVGGDHHRTGLPSGGLSEL